MLIPNLRAIVAREICRIGGFARLWERESEFPTDAYSLALAKRHRPRMLVFANRVYTGKGDFSVEDFLLLSPVELAAVCELMQASQSGAAAIEDWIRRWKARPIEDRTRTSLEDEFGIEIFPFDQEPGQAGQRRLPIEAQHRRSR